MQPIGKNWLASAAVGAVMFTGAAASAGDFYVSGRISATQLGHTIERNTGGFALPVPDTSGVSRVEETDFSAGLGFGYQQNFAQDRFFWGIEAFYDFEDSSSRNINGVLVTDVDVDSSYGARLLAGANITPDFNIYAHLGATVLDFDVTNSYTFAPPVRSASFDETGFSFGFGVGYNVTDSATIFAEYTQVEGIDFGGIPEVAGGTNRVNPNDLDFSKISLGVKFRF